MGIGKHIKRLTMTKKICREINRIYSKFKKDEILIHFVPDELDSDYYFVDRSRNHKILCMVLAGYADEIIDDTLKRIRDAALPDMDVCIMTSGKRHEKIEKICQDNGWSYLSTKKNQLSRIQNIAINLHPNAESVFKLDEDIFVPKNYFDTMYKDFFVAQKSRYQVEIMAPLINVNGYCYVRLLEKLGLVEEWETKFGECKYSEGLHHHREIWINAKAAQFMWGEGGNNLLSNLDELANKLNDEIFHFSVCPIRFSIGAIFFTREFWKEMGMLPAGKGNEMGLDESAICSHSLFASKPIIVCENICVYHLAYGPQKQAMIEYYKEKLNGRIRGDADIILDLPKS